MSAQARSCVASLAPCPVPPDGAGAQPCAACGGRKAGALCSACAERLEEEPVDEDELAAWEQYGRDMEAALTG